MTKKQAALRKRALELRKYVAVLCETSKQASYAMQCGDMRKAALSLDDLRAALESVKGSLGGAYDSAAAALERGGGAVGDAVRHHSIVGAGKANQALNGLGQPEWARKAIAGAGQAGRDAGSWMQANPKATMLGLGGLGLGGLGLGALGLTRKKKKKRSDDE